MGAIVILLVAGASITGALNNLWANFGSEVQKIATPKSSSIIEIVENIGYF